MRKHCISSFCTAFVIVVLSTPLLQYRVCSSPPDTVALQLGSTPRRLLSTYQSTPGDKSRVAEEESRSSMHQEGSGSEDTDESVYHLDYHGVKTHPSPTPKIPRLLNTVALPNPEATTADSP